MYRRNLTSVFAVFMIGSPAFAGGVVTLDIDSASNGARFRGGAQRAPIAWTITAHVSSGDNMGLACISVDLVQDVANPEALSLQPADAVPAAMTCFDRPAGISNPVNGYLGTPTSTNEGGVNILQIGGAQNTFGAPPPTQPPLTSFGLDADVDANIGQSPEGQIIASGFFTAPTSPGIYRVSLESPIANTLEYVNAAPKWSPVSPASVQMGESMGELVFTNCLAADVDGSLDVNSNDITAFVDLLLGEVPANQYSTCAADLNDDGFVNGEDIQPFVDAYLNA